MTAYDSHSTHWIHWNPAVPNCLKHFEAMLELRYDCQLWNCPALRREIFESSGLPVQELSFIWQASVEDTSCVMETNTVDDMHEIFPTKTFKLKQLLFKVFSIATLHDTGWYCSTVLLCALATALGSWCGWELGIPRVCNGHGHRRKAHGRVGLEDVPRSQQHFPRIFVGFDMFWSCKIWPKRQETLSNRMTVQFAGKWRF